MRVLVWNSYGSLRVYKADTPMDFFQIIKMIEEVTAMWGIDEEVEKLLEKFGTIKTPRDAEKLITNFVKNWLDDHEAFEIMDFAEVEVK